MTDSAPIIPIGDAKYLCIEYPGYVKNIDKAIMTMGGEKTINEALSGENPIGLRYRPKDIFSHQITGDFLPTAKLVAKVTRRVKKNSEGEVIEEDPNFKTEILGTAIKAVRFRALGDFQYILPKENKTRQLKEAMLKGDVEKIINYQIAKDDEDFDNLRSIPPPIFSPIEAPFSYNYRQSSSVIRVRVRQPDGSFKIKLINRSRQTGTEITSVRYEDDNIPLKSWHNLKEIQPGLQQELHDQFTSLFQERPLWTRHAIVCMVDPKYHKIVKQILPHHAYILSNGPWRECWVKYGVDPRKDIKYHFYQMVDIRRFFKEGHEDRRTIQTRRTINNPAHRYHREEEEEVTKPKYTKSSHLFDGVTISGLNSFYQLCDIIDPNYAPLINNPDYLKSTCTKYSGYYYYCVLARLRKTLRKKYFEIKETGSAEYIEDIEQGLAEEIRKEIEASNRSKEGEEEEEEERMEDDEEESGSVSTTDVEKLVKDAYAEISSNKRLKDVVDEYMTELENAGSKMDKELESTENFDMLEEYEEDIEEEVEEEEQVKPETIE